MKTKEEMQAKIDWVMREIKIVSRKISEQEKDYGVALPVTVAYLDKLRGMFAILHWYLEES